MSGQSPSTTKFVSRGRLRGVLRERPAMRLAPSASRSSHVPVEGGEARSPAFDEALYYRARLILGESLPRPAA